MNPAVYIETSIVSYLAARPSRDVRAAAWMEISAQWWGGERGKYDLFTSELVLAEARSGDADAARRRMAYLDGLPLLDVSDEVRGLAALLVGGGGVPQGSEADALHIAVASVHGMAYLLTWNCRHIDNAKTKPVVRSICQAAGYSCSEICTPLELMPEGESDA